jgi:hypothetical protein
VNKTLSELKQNKSIYSVSACMIHVKLFGANCFNAGGFIVNGNVINQGPFDWFPNLSL